MSNELKRQTKSESNRHSPTPSRIYSVTLISHAEFEKDGSFVPLEEVDASSEVIGVVTMLNTLKHYKVRNGSVRDEMGNSQEWLGGSGSALDSCHTSSSRLSV